MGSNKALMNVLQKTQKNLTLIQKAREPEPTCLNFAFNTQKLDFD